MRIENRNPAFQRKYAERPITRRTTKLDPRWPKWSRQCEGFSWQTGQQCKSYAVRGLTRCKKHGGGGLNAEAGWRRYLLWTLLPEALRPVGPMSPISAEAIEMVCNIIAQCALTGDVHASEGVRMMAAEYLMETQTVAKHPDPAALLTHLSREEALITVKVLRLNGLLK